MEIAKSFIRFVINDHGNGKIKCMNKIIKLFDKNDKFLYTQEPYISAGEGQIEIDIEGHDHNKYLPMRRFKHKDGKIIKRTEEEIRAIDLKYQQDKSQRLQEIQEKNNQIETNKNIIQDSGKTLQQRVDAMAELMKLKKI